MDANSRPSSAERTKEDFISRHVEVCTAKVARKYDPKKPSGAYHSSEYSKRKCAKNIWKKEMKRKSRRPADQLAEAEKLRKGDQRTEDDEFFKPPITVITRPE